MTYNNYEKSFYKLINTAIKDDFEKIMNNSIEKKYLVITERIHKPFMNIKNEYDYIFCKICQKNINREEIYKHSFRKMREDVLTNHQIILKELYNIKKLLRIKINKKIFIQYNNLGEDATDEKIIEAINATKGICNQNFNCLCVDHQNDTCKKCRRDKTMLFTILVEIINYVQFKAINEFGRVISKKGWEKFGYFNLNNKTDKSDFLINNITTPKVLCI